MFTSVVDNYKLVKLDSKKLEFGNRCVLDMTIVGNRLVCVMCNDPKTHEGLVIVGENINDYIVTVSRRGECRISVINENMFHIESEMSDYGVSTNFCIVNGEIIKIEDCKNYIDSYYTVSGLCVTRHECMGFSVIKHGEVINKWNGSDYFFSLFTSGFLMKNILFANTKALLIYDEKMNKFRQLVNEIDTTPIDGFAYNSDRHIVVTESSMDTCIWDERYNKTPISKKRKKYLFESLVDMGEKYMYYTDRLGSRLVDYDTGEEMSSSDVGIRGRSIMFGEYEYVYTGDKVLYKTEWSFKVL